MTHNESIVIEIFGEGRTDMGDVALDRPTAGVLPIMLHNLCGKPDNMRVKRAGRPFMLQKGTLKQKVRFARRQAYYNQSDGAVYVVDSDGELRRRKSELEAGRNLGPSELPMAVGVAHPCIESWLLADADAVHVGLSIKDRPELPGHPEELPTPCRDRQHNPKTVLAACGGSLQKELSTEDKNRIAAAINDMDVVRQRCPKGFAPFADEVETHIRPLFR